MTIKEKIVRIREDFFHELRDKEKIFIDDMYDGVDGLPQSLSDEDISEYLTERQISWINDIATSLGLDET